MAERMTRKVAAAFMKEHGISGEPLICDRCGEVLEARPSDATMWNGATEIKMLVQPVPLYASDVSAG